MGTEDHLKTDNSSASPLSRPQIVIGLGTGRCGTNSLAHFLDLQEGADVTHEMFQYKLAWRGSEKRIDKLLQWLKLQTEQHLVGDVASPYLPYVGYILFKNPHVKFICLQRDRTTTIESFLRKTVGRNHWVEQDGSQWQADLWDGCFPKYVAASKAEAIALYWDEYYAIAAELQATYPAAFRVFPIDALNQPEGQRAMLDFVGIPYSQMRLSTFMHYNRSAPSPLPSQAQLTSPMLANPSIHTSPL